MTVSLGLLALLEAKPGKGAELAAFLEAGRDLALAEDGTVTWYAFKLADTTYGIFDTFESPAGRDAHLSGEIPKALAQVGPDLLARDPDIRTVDVIAVKWASPQSRPWATRGRRSTARAAVSSEAGHSGRMNAPTSVGSPSNRVEGTQREGQMRIPPIAIRTARPG